MKQELIVDEKIVSWRRNYVTVEADSLEEAIGIIKDDGEYEVDISEIIYEDVEDLKDAEHAPTLEIFDTSYKLLYSNDIFSKLAENSD